MSIGIGALVQTPNQTPNRKTNMSSTLDFDVRSTTAILIVNTAWDAHEFTVRVAVASESMRCHRVARRRGREFGPVG